MEIFEKEEIELIKNFRLEKQNKKVRQSMYETIYNAMQAFQEAGGVIKTLENGFSKYVVINDLQFKEEEGKIVLFISKENKN